jgi:hypothetical protein
VVLLPPLLVVLLPPELLLLLPPPALLLVVEALAPADPPVSARGGGPLEVDKQPVAPAAMSANPLRLRQR